MDESCETHEDSPRARRYTTIDDVVDWVVRPALDAQTGYDLQAIAHDITEYIPGDPRPDGNLDVSRAGFEVTASSDEFWEAVERHEIGSD